jgi:hypothetical protein
MPASLSALKHKNCVENRTRVNITHCKRFRNASINDVYHPTMIKEKFSISLQHIFALSCFFFTSSTIFYIILSFQLLSL